MSPRVLRRLSLFALGGVVAGITVACCSTARPQVIDDVGSVAPIIGELPEAIRPETAAGPYPERLRIGNRQLVLNGSGLCEWGFLGIDLYHGALYVERASTDAAELLAAEGVSVIHLQFVRSLSKAQLGKAYTAAVRANAGDRMSEFQSAVDQLCSLLGDVADGQSWTFTVQPDSGVRLQFCGRYAGEVEDSAFARLFLRLYLGNQPPTEALKQALLGAR